MIYLGPVNGLEELWTECQNRLLTECPDERILVTMTQNIERLLRNGLSYAQANANCNRLSSAAYDAAISSGKSIEEAQETARKAYNAEMDWYQS